MNQRDNIDRRLQLRRDSERPDERRSGRDRRIDSHVVAANERRIAKAWSARFQDAIRHGFSRADARDHADAEAERVRKEING